LLFPQRCSVKEKGTDCFNPPNFVISILEEKGEYMIGVTCQTHKERVSEKLAQLQKDDKIPKGKLSFTELKGVGTDCIKASPDDRINL